MFMFYGPFRTRGFVGRMRGTAGAVREGTANSQRESAATRARRSSPFATVTPAASECRYESASAVRIRVACCEEHLMLRRPFDRLRRQPCRSRRDVLVPSVSMLERAP